MTATAQPRARRRGRRAGPRLRRVELGIITLVGVVIVVAYSLASLGTSASIPANLGPFLVWILGLLLLAHVATRRLAPLADPTLLPLCLLLNGIGYVMIVRLATEVRSTDELARLQSLWTAVGIAAYIVTLLVIRRVKVLINYRYLLGGAGVALILMPLLPVIGREFYGARIWVSLGPVNFQPGEFAKIALAIFFAGYLFDTRDLLRARLEIRDLAPIGGAWLVSLAVMVFERDLGSSLLFFTLFVVVLWVASERSIFLVVGGGLFAAGAYMSWRTFSHVQERVDIWLDPFADAKGKGFQIVESTFALADGGLTGTGLGRGSPSRIPLIESDFIFAAIGEELGLAGSVAIVMAFMLIIGAGFRIAMRADSAFETLLATGLTTLIGVQAFIIMGGIVRLVPLTGITLPFVSYGGSSLVANYILLALLMRMSDERQAAAMNSGSG